MSYKLTDSDSENSEKASFLSHDIEDRPDNTPKSPARITLSMLLRSFGIFMLGAIFAMILVTFTDRFGRRRTYETGFAEERLVPSSVIQLEERRFTTPVGFQLDGTPYLVTSPGETMYVGQPSHEIDQAWEELFWGRYFSISEEEAKDLWGADYRIYHDTVRTGYTVGFDMFHQLHCLDHIRQALYPDYYHETPIHGKVHLDHCINHLRQAIQCWGSTAIVPSKWVEGLHKGYAQSDTIHTCRKFEPIRAYLSERFNGSLAVPREGKSVKEIWAE